jgi:flagellar FliJ protein
MARFSFKLEPVLRHRRMIEDEHQRELAQLLREQMILESRMHVLQGEITRDKSSMGSALVGRVDVSRIRQHGAHQGRVAVHLQEIASRLFMLHRQIDDRRSQLIEATRARKAVEILKDKQYRRWRDEQNRRENRELDELSTQAYTRRMQQDDLVARTVA